MPFADLHLHTFFSDGTYSPEELVARARDGGFSAIALTDHDTIEGCARAAAACVEQNMEFVPGTELTAQHEEHEIHILGYYMDTSDAQFLAEVDKFQHVRQDRIREIVVRLNTLGVPLAAQAVFDLANCRSPGRPHVARALVQAGVCSSLDEAFERFLKKNRPAFVPKFRMSAARAIELIHNAGGLAVLAHPGLNHADEVIDPIAECGLDGIECFHTKHSTTTAEHYLQIADRLELLVTGGSDCHGMNKGKPLIGTIKLPYQHVEKLKERVNKRKASTTEPGTRGQVRGQH